MAIARTQLTESEVEDFIRKSTRNMAKLRDNLLLVGYKFSNSNGPMTFASESGKKLISELESDWGQIPIVIRRWYETFHDIDFSQAQDQLFSDTEEDVAGLGYNCSLVFRNLEFCLSFRNLLAEDGVVIFRENASAHFLPFGSFASNCSPKGVWIPDSGVDPEIYNDGIAVTFANEIRLSFEHAGFPFWEKMNKKRIISTPLQFSPNFIKLKPILLNGLVLNGLESV